jgi:protein-disulfide isomerase/tRNA A-37 threonylcarbamoyl transferase component Bud32
MLRAMATQPELSRGATFAGDFEILGPLGEGGMGALYVARQRSTGAQRALKVMQPELVRSPELRARFEQEARIGARIESDHVAQVLAAGVDADSGMPWIAMELLRGETLAERVARAGPLPWPEVVAIFGQMCHALAGAHRLSIVHRDLKPENIFLATPRVVGVDLMVKLLDFGIAKVVAESTSTQTGVIGTPIYMAPEQYQGRGIGPATDVWALGLIAFHLLTARNYWRSVGGTTSGPASLMYEVCMEDILPASVRAQALGVAGYLPPGFDAWFARCVARDPAARFADAGQVIAAMRAVGVGGTVPLPVAAAARPSGGTAFLGADFSPPHDAVPAGQAPYGQYGWGQGSAAPGIAPFGPPRPALPGLPPESHGKRGAPGKRGAEDRFGKIVIALLSMLLLGAFGFAVWASRSAARADADGGADTADGGALAAAWSDEQSPIPVSSSDPIWGSRAAPVTVVLFSDFQCPFCARLVPTFASLRETYGPDKLRIVWKHNPLAFHANARPAALAAEAVFRLGGSKAFWAFHDAAFANQKDLNADNYEGWAARAGVDRDAFRAELARPEVAAKIDADVAEAKAVGASGTPYSFVNGVLLSGALPPEKFTAAIDDQLKAASAATAAGTRADAVYVTLSKQNKENAPKNEPKKDPPAAPVDDDRVYTVPVGDSPRHGSAAARVTIVEFADFQCPFCSRVEVALAQVRDAYGEKVAFVWKNQPLPFHEHAEPAAELAMEANAQGKFWAAHDLLFKNQQHLGNDDLTGYAQTLGLDVARVQAAIANKKHAARIAADQKLGTELGASGTPTFFINGRRLVGAQPFEKFKAAVDRALAELPAGGARPRRRCAPGDPLCSDQ